MFMRQSGPKSPLFYSSVLALVGLFFWRRIPGRLLLCLPFLVKIGMEVRISLIISGILDLMLKKGTVVAWIVGLSMFAWMSLAEIVLYGLAVLCVLLMKGDKPDRQPVQEERLPRQHDRRAG
jgi:hypothetical protein